MSIFVSLLMVYLITLLSKYNVQSVLLTDKDSYQIINHADNLTFHSRLIQQGIDSSCYPKILSAASSTNTSTDYELDQREFIVLCNLLSNNTFAGYTNFTNFPLPLVRLYNSLVVASNNGGETIHVQSLVNSINLNQTLDTNQSIFYTNMCFKVNQSIHESIMSIMPSVTHIPTRLATSRIPTVHPTVISSPTPTSYPTQIPTVRPSFSSSARPSTRPTVYPTHRPSSRPTSNPTTTPSYIPTVKPTTKPTKHPTAKPSSTPTIKPSDRPTSKPSVIPTIAPSRRPTILSTVYPTKFPSRRPSHRPSSLPSLSKSKKPTFSSSSFQISSSFILVNTAGLTTTKIVSKDEYVIMLDSSFRKLVQYVLSSCSTNQTRVLRQGYHETRYLLLTSTDSRIVSLQDIGM